ncbi:UNVERIFIED_CONTAM: hypothetical protein FKN15_019868 [Acipenser sinensis]
MELAQEEVDDNWELFLKGLAAELCPGCGAYGHTVAICPTQYEEEEELPLQTEGRRRRQRGRKTWEEEEWCTQCMQYGHEEHHCPELLQDTDLEWEELECPAPEWEEPKCPEPKRGEGSACCSCRAAVPASATRGSGPPFLPPPPEGVGPPFLPPPPEGVGPPFLSPPLEVPPSLLLLEGPGSLPAFMGFEVATGAAARLVSGYDSYGNICGQKNTKVEGIEYSGLDQTKNKYVFFLDPCNLDIVKRRIKSIALCVAECPSTELHTLKEVQEFGKNNGDPVKNEQGFVEFKMSGPLQYMSWYHFVGLIWISEFILACQQMTVAGAVVTYYFTRDKANLTLPILTSVFRLLRYHIGTVAKGSFIITLVKIPRLILMYIHSQLKGKNAYAATAINSTNFCTSARDAFVILVENALRVAGINTIGDFVLFLGKICPFRRAGCADSAGERENQREKREKQGTGLKEKQKERAGKHLGRPRVLYRTGNSRVGRRPEPYG